MQYLQPPQRQVNGKYGELPQAPQPPSPSPEDEGEQVMRKLKSLEPQFLSYLFGYRILIHHYIYGL
jgi:hypothetical protein